MIVNTLKMCPGDAGPEQSLVLFIYLSDGVKKMRKLGILVCFFFYFQNLRDPRKFG